MWRIHISGIRITKTVGKHPERRPGRQATSASAATCEAPGGFFADCLTRTSHARPGYGMRNLATSSDVKRADLLSFTGLT